MVNIGIFPVPQFSGALVVFRASSSEVLKSAYIDLNYNTRNATLTACSMTGMNRHFINQLGNLLTLKVKVPLSNIVIHLLSVFFFCFSDDPHESPVKGCMKTFL